MYFGTSPYIRIIIEKNIKRISRSQNRYFCFYRSPGFPKDFVINNQIINEYIGKLLLRKNAGLPSFAKIRSGFKLHIKVPFFITLTKIIRHDFRKLSPSKIGKLKIVTVKCV